MQGAVSSLTIQPSYLKERYSFILGCTGPSLQADFLGAACCCCGGSSDCSALLQTMGSSSLRCPAACGAFLDQGWSRVPCISCVTREGPLLQPANCALCFPLASLLSHLYTANKMPSRNKPDSVSFSSVAQSCLTLCDPKDCSTPGLPVHHQLPEFTPTPVHGVGDAFQPSHPVSSPFPPAFTLSQHQGLFQ